MGSQRGIPNRKRFHQVCAPHERAGFEVQAQVIELFGRQLVEQERPRLAQPFRDMSPESLDVKTAILTFVKPREAGRRSRSA
jgi:hypothetical protein